MRSDQVTLRNDWRTADEERSAWLVQTCRSPDNCYWSDCWQELPGSDPGWCLFELVTICCLVDKFGAGGIRIRPAVVSDCPMAPLDKMNALVLHFHP